MDFKNFLKKYYPLLIILLVASFLRFYGLLQNPISLYSDEVDIGYQVQSILKTGCDYLGSCIPIQFHSFSDVRTPLPIYFTAFLHIVGIPLDYSIRMNSAIFGVLGIIATYLLLENLFSKETFNIKLKNIGSIGAGILCLLPWHLTYSRIGFELTSLYFFIVFGFYLFTKYMTDGRNIFLILSVIFIGLSPMVYSTAKVAIIVYPVILLLLPGGDKLFRNNITVKIAFFAMFLPLLIMFISGGVASRFNYLSIFTDPTASTTVNYNRLLDNGPAIALGTAPSISSKLFHNKPLFYVSKFSNNLFNLLSTQFLFITGDPNLRQSIGGWGMLYHSLFPILLIGLYFLIKSRQERLVIFLGLLTLLAMITSAVTRDGGDHASRSFMMILPLIIICSFGLAYLRQLSKIVFSLIILLILSESTYYLHDYWYHYRYDSAGYWSYGMSEIIGTAKKYPSQPIIISPKYENPLIFYLYYSEFDPKKFQQFVKTKTVFYDKHGENNLDGYRVGDTQLYIATLVNFNERTDNSLPGAVYFLTKLEAENSNFRLFAKKSRIIRLPHGQPLYYEIQL